MLQFAKNIFKIVFFIYYFLFLTISNLNILKNTFFEDALNDFFLSKLQGNFYTRIRILNSNLLTQMNTDPHGSGF
jgi:hypothetical protein